MKREEPIRYGSALTKLRVDVTFGKKRTTIKPGQYSVAELKRRAGWPESSRLAILSGDEWVEMSSKGFVDVDGNEKFARLD